MIKKYFITLIFLVPYSIFSQIDFEEIVIIDRGGRTFSVFDKGDIDNDGDIDLVVYTSPTIEANSLEKIIWFENLDSKGTYNTGHTIDLPNENIITSHKSSIKLIDIDGDNDLDITYIHDKRAVKCLKNNGEGKFGEPMELTQTSPHTVVFKDITDYDFKDINNDGFLDIIVVNGEDMLLFKGTSSNSFSGEFKYILHEAEWMNRLSFLDVNNDGFLDIITYAHISGNVGIIRNEGEYKFSDYEPITDNFDSVEKIVPLDIDGDLDEDLIGVNSSNKIIWYENSEGNFEKEHIVQQDTSSRGFIEVIDLNSDGRKEIVYINNSDELVWSVTGSNNPFENQQLISVNLDDIYEKSGVDFADVDNDSVLDLLVSGKHINFDGSEMERLTIYKSIGSFNNFTSPTIINDYTLYPELFSFADVNSDGKQDIIGGSLFTSRLFWSENFELSTYKVLNTIDEFEGKIISLFAEDIDNDGDYDIIVSRRGRGANGVSEILLYENLDGKGNFSAKKIIDNSLVIVIGDIDNDGDIDLIGEAHLYENNGLGSFSKKNLPEEDTGNTLGDIDNDGFPELIDGFWLRKNDDGVFGDKTQFIEYLLDEDNGFSPLSNMLVKDVDNDGLKDIIVGTRKFFSDTRNWEKSLNDLVVYKNLDGENFSKPIIIEKYRRRTMVEQTGLIDIDNDGDEDLFVLLVQYHEGTDGADHELAYYLNDGKGNFSEKTTIPYTNNWIAISHFSSGDFDNDGDVDLLLTSSKTHSVVLYKNISDTSTLTIEDLTLINNEDLILYPNPVIDSFTIETDLPVKKIVIYNQLGVELYNFKSIDNIDISYLNEGVYYVKVFIDSNRKKDYILKKMIKRS